MSILLGRRIFCACEHGSLPCIPELGQKLDALQIVQPADPIILHRTVRRETTVHECESSLSARSFERPGDDGLRFVLTVKPPGMRKELVGLQIKDLGGSIAPAVVIPPSDHRLYYRVVCDISRKFFRIDEGREDLFWRCIYIDL